MGEELDTIFLCILELLFLGILGVRLRVYREEVKIWWVWLGWRWGYWEVGGMWEGLKDRVEGFFSR